MEHLLYLEDSGTVALGRGALVTWGEWLSGLRRCSKNRKIPGSIPIRRSAGLRDPTSLRGSR